MANQKKIIDLHEGRTHITCIQFVNDRYNPYHVYLIITPKGLPVRKRLLVKYGDFMSVLCFLRDFFINGLDAMAFCEMKEWIESRSI